MTAQPIGDGSSVDPGVQGTSGTQLPSGRSAFAAAAIGDDIFVLGGATEGYADTDDVLVLHTVSGSVEKVGTLPTPRRGPTGAAFGSSVFVFGGYDNRRGYLSEIVEFDSITRTSQTLSVHLPVAMDAISAVTVADGIYLIGGNSGSGQVYDTIFKFTPSSKTLSLVGHLTRPIGLTSSVWTGSHILIFGGLASHNEKSRATLEFDPITGITREVENIFPRGLVSSAAIWTGNEVLLFGGTTTDGPSREILALDPVRFTTREWNQDLPSAITDTASVRTGNRAWVIGGDDWDHLFVDIVPFDLPRLCASNAISASGDTFVDHGQPNSNFNNVNPNFVPSDRILLTDHDTSYGGEDSRYMLVKFDLASISGCEITSVRLRLYTEPDPNDCGAGIPICTGPSSMMAVYATPNNWQESQVTWNTAPSPTAKITALSWTRTEGWYSIDVTNDIRSRISGGETSASYKIRIEDPGNGKYALIDSRATSRGPLLAVGGALQDPSIMKIENLPGGLWPNVDAAGRVYVTTNVPSQPVARIDLAGSVSLFAHGGTGSYLTAVVGDKLFIPSAGTRSIEVISLPSGAPLASISTGNDLPMYIVPSLDNSHVFVTLRDTSHVWSIDSTTFARTGDLSLGSGSNLRALCVDQSSGKLYVAHAGGSVFVVNPTSFSVERSFTARGAQDFILCDGDHRTVYVGNGNAATTIGAFNMDTGASLGAIQTGLGSDMMALDRAHARLFVTAFKEDKVYVVDTETRGIIGTLEAGKFPYGIVYDDARDRLVVANYDDPTYAHPSVWIYDMRGTNRHSVSSVMRVESPPKCAQDEAPCSERDLGFTNAIESNADGNFDFTINYGAFAGHNRVRQCGDCRWWMQFDLDASVTVAAEQSIAALGHVERKVSGKWSPLDNGGNVSGAVVRDGNDLSLVLPNEILLKPQWFGQRAAEYRFVPAKDAAVSLRAVQAQLVAPPVAIVHGWEVNPFFDPSKEGADWPDSMAIFLEEEASKTLGQNPWAWANNTFLNFSWSGKADVVKVAPRLRDEVATWLDGASGQRWYSGVPNFIGFSTGGILSRMVLEGQQVPDGDPGGRIAMLQTPNLGSAHAPLYTRAVEASHLCPISDFPFHLDECSYYWDEHGDSLGHAGYAPVPPTHPRWLTRIVASWGDWASHGIVRSSPRQGPHAFPEVKADFELFPAPFDTPDSNPILAQLNWKWRDAPTWTEGSGNQMPERYRSIFAYRPSDLWLGCDRGESDSVVCRESGNLDERAREDAYLYSDVSECGTECAEVIEGCGSFPLHALSPCLRGSLHRILNHLEGNAPLGEVQRMAAVENSASPQASFAVLTDVIPRDATSEASFVVPAAGTVAIALMNNASHSSWKLLLPDGNIVLPNPLTIRLPFGGLFLDGIAASGPAGIWKLNVSCPDDLCAFIAEATIPTPVALGGVTFPTAAGSPRIIAVALAPAEESAGLRVVVNVVEPSGATTELTLAENGQGRFEAPYSPPEPGAFVLNVTVLAEVDGSIVVPPQERVFVVPGAPENVMTSSGPRRGEVSLSWDPPTSAPFAPAFRVYVATSASDPFVPVATLQATKWTINGLEADASFLFEVAALTGDGEGPRSTPVVGIAAAGVPYVRDLIARPGQHDGTVELSWSDPIATMSVGTRFDVLRGFSPDSLARVARVEGGSYVDRGLEGGTTYYYAVDTLSDSEHSGASDPVAVVAPGGEANPPVPELPTIWLTAGALGVAVLIGLRRRSLQNRGV